LGGRLRDWRKCPTEMREKKRRACGHTINERVLTKHITSIC
jgi:hypothetical protein